MIALSACLHSLLGIYFFLNIKAKALMSRKKLIPTTICKLYKQVALVHKKDKLYLRPTIVYYHRIPRR